MFWERFEPGIVTNASVRTDVFGVDAALPEFGAPIEAIRWASDFGAIFVWSCSRTGGGEIKAGGSFDTLGVE